MPKTFGNAMPYVSGNGTDTDVIDLPRDTGGYRQPHHQHARKTIGIDWAATAPTCKACTQKSSTVNTSTGLCATCAPPAKKNSQQEAQAGQPTTRRSAPRAITAEKNSRRARDLGASAPREKNPAAAQETRPAAAAGPLDHPDEIATSPQPAAASPSQATPVPAAAAGTPDHDNLDLGRELARAARLLTDSHNHASPAVQALRGRVLGVLDALEAFLEVTRDRPTEPTERAEPGTITPGPSSQPAATPRARAARSTSRPDATSERGPRRDKIQLDGPAIAAAYLDGQNLAQLAHDHGVSSPTIARRLDEQGVVRRKQAVDYTPELIAEVRHLYLDEHLNQAEVADRLGLTLKVVQTAMKRGDVPARDSASNLSQQGIGHVIKIPRDQHPIIVQRYLDGEPAPAIAVDYDCSATSIYPILNAAGITQRHGNRSTPGHDGAAALKDLIRIVDVPVCDIKSWAIRRGLLHEQRPGLPPMRVVRAYAQAHHVQLDTQEVTG